VHSLVFVSISANRFRSRLHDYVGNLAQDSLIVDAANTPDIELFIADNRLVAYLTATEAIRTPEQAHAACMHLLPERHCAMAPGRYVLVDGIPDDSADERSWRKLTVIAEGDGRIKPDDVVFG